MINGFYLDESGNNGFGDIVNQPIVCYGGVLVPNYSVERMERDFEMLSFKSSEQIKSKILGLPREHINKLPFFRDYEIHSKAFFDGDDLYSKIPSVDRFAIVEEMLDLISRHDCVIFASVIDKESYRLAHGNDTGHTNMHQLGMARLVGLIEQHLTIKNETGIVVPDSGREDERELLIKVIREEASSGRLYNNLFLQHSHHNQLVQLADIVVFLITIYYRNVYGHVSRKKYNEQLIDLFNKNIKRLNRKIWQYPLKENK